MFWNSVINTINSRYRLAFPWHRDPRLGLIRRSRNNSLPAERRYLDNHNYWLKNKAPPSAPAPQPKTRTSINFRSKLIGLPSGADNLTFAVFAVVILHSLRLSEPIVLYWLRFDLVTPVGVAQVDPDAERLRKSKVFPFSMLSNHLTEKTFPTTRPLHHL